MPEVAFQGNFVRSKHSSVGSVPDHAHGGDVLLSIVYAPAMKLFRTSKKAGGRALAHLPAQIVGGRKLDYGLGTCPRFAI